MRNNLLRLGARGAGLMRGRHMAVAGLRLSCDGVLDNNEDIMVSSTGDTATTTTGLLGEAAETFSKPCCYQKILCMYIGMF